MRGTAGHDPLHAGSASSAIARTIAIRNIARILLPTRFTTDSLARPALEIGLDCLGLVRCCREVSKCAQAPYGKTSVPSNYVLLDNEYDSHVPHLSRMIWR